MAVRVASSTAAWRSTSQPAESRALRIVAEQLIWAAPVFLVPHVFAGHEELKAAAAPPMRRGWSPT